MHPDRTLTGKIQKPMSASPPSLEELRREIDEIDDAIHDLLMRRAQVVEQVGIAKRPDNQIVRLWRGRPHPAPAGSRAIPVLSPSPWWSGSGVR